MEPILNAQHTYASNELYYAALLARFRYLANKYARKTSLGICSKELEELLCLRAKKFSIEVELGIIDGGDIVIPDPPGGGGTDPELPTYLEQNNKITASYYGYHLGTATNVSNILHLLNTRTLTVASDEIHFGTVVVTREKKGVLVNYVERYALKPGKGVYGGGADQLTLTEEDILLVHSEPLGTGEYNTTTNVIILGAGTDVANAVNQASFTQLDREQPHIFTFDDTDYLYIGSQPASVGTGGTPVTLSDFQELIPVEFVDVFTQQLIGGRKTFSEKVDATKGIDSGTGGVIMAPLSGSLQKDPEDAAMYAEANRIAFVTSNSVHPVRFTWTASAPIDLTIQDKSGTVALKEDHPTNDELDNLLDQRGDKHFAYTQETSATTWDVTHNLNKYPSVTIMDQEGNMVLAEIEYVSTNQLRILFNSEMRGKAYLN